MENIQFGTRAENRPCPICNGTRVAIITDSKTGKQSTAPCKCTTGIPATGYMTKAG